MFDSCSVLFFFTIISLFIRETKFSGSELEVVSSGIVPVRAQDFAIIFYIDVRNNDEENAYKILTSMEQCCEQITEEDQDCDTIDLYGGDMGLLRSKESRNFTLISPNLYVYNRKGSCTLKIQYHLEGSFKKNQFRYKIDFDTSSNQKCGTCDTPDLDPMDNCLPVNCLIKYSGYRNFFDRRLRRCQPVPTCVSDYTKEMPDVAYNPNNNECVDLVKPLSRQDLKKLTENGAEFSDSRPKLLNVRCHHGHIDRTSGVCICDPGWKSEPLDSDDYNPSTAVYHMCNIQCHNFASYVVESKIDVGVAFLAGMLPALLLCLCICCCDQFFQNSYLKICDESPELQFYEVNDRKCSCLPPNTKNYAPCRCHPHKRGCRCRGTVTEFDPM